MNEVRETTLMTKKYKAFYSYPALRRDGGLKTNAAILVSNQLQATTLTKEEDLIAVTITGNILTAPICAISLYVKETKTREEKEEFLEKLYEISSLYKMNEPSGKIIIMGDFNM